MALSFYLPTKVLMDSDCVRKNAAAFKTLGKKALIVTGRHSAKANGSLRDVTEALASQGMEWALFAEVEANPSVTTVRSGAAAAKQAGADCIIGIGGGSPMDTAKAIALLSCQELSDEDLFAGRFGPEILPMALLPTTAGTGSEVTNYSILTNDRVESKSNIASPVIFPKLALIDAKYTRELPLSTTVNTALDSFSHSVEGMLSVRANPLSNLLAAEGIVKIAGCFESLLSGKLTDENRADLLYASALGGMVIAQTGTTAVHAMGYSLTYFHHIDHGRANGLLLAAFLAFTEKKNPEIVRSVLDRTGYAGVSELKGLLDRLLGKKEIIPTPSFEKYSDMAMRTKNIANCVVAPDRQDLFEMYAESFR